MPAGLPKRRPGLLHERWNAAGEFCFRSRLRFIWLLVADAQRPIRATAPFGLAASAAELGLSTAGTVHSSRTISALRLPDAVPTGDGRRGTCLSSIVYGDWDDCRLDSGHHHCGDSVELFQPGHGSIRRDSHFPLVDLRLDSSHLGNSLRLDVEPESLNQ